MIIQEIGRRGSLKDFMFLGLESAFVTCAEMACLLHDVGNPPFRHFGEIAIKEWVKKWVVNFKKTPPKFIKECDDKLKEKVLRDLSSFDGNAQAIRLVHSLLQLNLTYSQIAAILKYTRPAYEEKLENANCRIY